MSTDAPEDEQGVVGASPARRSLPPGVPLILQVSPLDAESSKQDEFFYDAFAHIESGNFAMARAFFIHHGHVVVFHKCPDAIAFQELFTQATIGCISTLPDGLIVKGHELLESQCDILRLSNQAALPPPATPLQSILD
jgi:hypothetical protein